MTGGNRFSGVRRIVTLDGGGGRVCPMEVGVLRAASGIDGLVDGQPDVTDLIRRAQRGDSEAAETLVATTYGDLRKLARARLRSGGRSVLLDTTSLINEWYVRFARTHGAKLKDRVHFMRHAASVMRSVIVDFARRRNAERRGGGAFHETLSFEIPDGGRTGEADIVRVHEALEELVKLDARMAEIVEMRFFAGMTESEIAQALGISERTVRRDWEKARLFLAEALA